MNCNRWISFFSSKLLPPSVPVSAGDSLTDCRIIIWITWWQKERQRKLILLMKLVSLCVCVCHRWCFTFATCRLLFSDATGLELVLNVEELLFSSSSSPFLYSLPLWHNSIKRLQGETLTHSNISIKYPVFSFRFRVSHTRIFFLFSLSLSFSL